MSSDYDHRAVQAKWQEKWEAVGLYRQRVDWDKPKHYALTMLPYPSGDLHMGHWFAMTPSDARARFMRMKGFNVLFPMGFDAFGLPAENAAIQRNIHPARWTYDNIRRMREQLRSMGAMFDWEREAISCDPSYYHWTQWFFKRFFESDLAYRGEAVVNWSPTLQTVLANEQVIDGKDERTGQPVVQKMMAQWFFRYTRYADEMLDFSRIDWPEPVKIMQTNWIGRSEGARVTFTAETGDPIEVYTTRPDTLWGATFMVLAPEHPLVDKIARPEQRAQVEAYQTMAARATEIERAAEDREKTGVFTGAYAINPVNEERVPIWIADYVMITYGTGAIMAVPAHDQRDLEFARKFALPVRIVIRPEGSDISGDVLEEAWPGEGVMVNSGPFDGTPVTSEKGRKNPAIAAVIDWLEARGMGEEAVNYRLRDWLISRQRYWGSPIPMVRRQDGDYEAVPGDALPVLLPDDVEMTGVGNPLAQHEEFVRVTDGDGNPARRETDTMDTFMCSSWYQYRYLSPEYHQGPFDPEEAAYWLPVDTYTGGAEHATMHLLYTRWFTKAMRDLGMFDEAIEIMRAHGRDPEVLDWGEPMLQLRNQGQVLGAERQGDYILARGESVGDRLLADWVQVVSGPDHVPAGFDGVFGEIMKRTENLLRVDMAGVIQLVEVKPEADVDIPRIEGVNDVNQLREHLEIQRMSKSKGNVVNPDELVERYGTDVVRTYLMFAFDWTKGGPWNPEGIRGPQRFLQDVWALGTEGYVPAHEDAAADRALRRKVHQTIHKVGADLESFSFNTAVAALMELRNAMSEAQRAASVSPEAWQEAVRSMLLLLSPIAPFLAEELWERQGYPFSVHQQSWPNWDPDVAAEETITLIVQVNGKVRDKIDVPAGISKADAEAVALASEKIQGWLDGKTPRKVVVIPGRLVNIVV
jgi:leucyl-tRNA synthetase